MPTSYFTMWAMLGLMTFGAIGGFLLHGNLIGTIRQAYPSDSIRQEALRRCSQMDAGFSRFSAEDRQNCYRAILPGSAQASSLSDLGRPRR